MAHDIGGIVVKRALNMASQEQNWQDQRVLDHTHVLVSIDLHGSCLDAHPLGILWSA